ncbi:hypothetical protein GCM10020219_079860 [Nonomuraea dietziae]
MNRAELAEVLRTALARVRPHKAGSVFSAAAAARSPWGPDEDDAAGRASVGTLRAAQARYPDDPDLVRLIAELRRGSPRFDELWREGRSSPWRTATKSVSHPSLGTVSLDCDAMLLPDGHQTVLVYSAEPGSPQATVLDMLRVLGLPQV